MNSDTTKDASRPFSFVDTAFGSPSRRNNVVAIIELPILSETADGLMTQYRFGDDNKHRYNALDSIYGVKDGARRREHRSGHAV